MKLAFMSSVWPGATLTQLIEAGQRHGCQAIEFRRPLKSSALLEHAHHLVRERVGFAEQDRIFADDIVKITAILSDFSFVNELTAFAGKQGIHLNQGYHEFTI
jgi:histidine ammonia-lyase